MENIKFANVTAFIIFFGIALIEALQKGNWLEGKNGTRNRFGAY